MMTMSDIQKLQLKYDCAVDNYTNFIADLRDKARDKDKFSHRRPVLPLKSDANPAYVDVNLLEGGLYKGLAKITRYNLRLISYEDPFGNLVNVDEYKLYDDDDDDSRLVSFGVEGLLLGLFTFKQALNSLACKNFEKKLTNNSQQNFDVRTSLAVLCLVLCEASKFELFSCMLGSAFKSGLEFPLTSWLLERINDWRLISDDLAVGQHCFDTANCDSYMADQKNNWHDGRRVIGATCLAVAQSLGILRALPRPPSRMVDVRLLGTSLVEIYSVSVFINGGRSGRIYGTITLETDKVNTESDTCYFYNRDHTNSEFIDSHGKLSLQDPNYFISVNKWFKLSLNLLENGADNLEISEGFMLWDKTGEDVCNTRYSSLVRGKNGYAIVYYCIPHKAVLAEVEATLIRKEDYSDTSHVCVYGRFSARSGNFVYAVAHHEIYYQTMLFDKPVSKELSCTLEACNRVKLGEAMKLSRSRVSVRVDSSLVVVADLKNCQGRPIVTGSLKWRPMGFGFQGIIEGHSNDPYLLQVKVKCMKIV